MFIDARSLPADAILEADLCIVGSGIAGLHLAMRLKDSGRSIIVLEAGADRGFVATGLPISPDSRRVVYGGTSTVWGGLLCPLGPIDFKKRSWVPYSGWPFSFETLAPFYDKAARFLGAPMLADFATDDAHCAPFEGSEFRPIAFYLMNRDRLDFGKRFRPDLEASNFVRILLDAPVSHLTPSEDGSRVVSVCARRGELLVRAREFVLAAGGIENPRILLASKSSAHPQGIGNAYDQVGRYYMDHPKLRLGELLLTQPFDYAAHWGVGASAGTRIIGIRLSDAVQEEKRLLNSYAHAAYVEDRSYRFAAKLMGRRPRRRSVELMNYLEQAPDPKSRVTLDASGRASVEWRLGNEDSRSLMVIHQMMKEDLERKNAGTLRSPLTEGGDMPLPKDASHHMGTTRMGEDPASSVTNADARVHGVKNLYIAGSSLFPTGGYANPTYTIFALTEKLAEHLESIHGKT